MHHNGRPCAPAPPGWLYGTRALAWAAALALAAPPGRLTARVIPRHVADNQLPPRPPRPLATPAPGSSCDGACMRTVVEFMVRAVWLTGPPG
jgi:hypothetical protein